MLSKTLKLNSLTTGIKLSVNLNFWELKYWKWGGKERKIIKYFIHFRMQSNKKMQIK